jgi:hypothetical protein
VGKRAVLLLVTKRDVCAYKEQYPGESQQNIANCFCNLWVNPSISQFSIVDVIYKKGEKKEIGD